MERIRLDVNAKRVIAARLISHTGGTAGFFVGVWGTAAYELDATPGRLALLMAGLAVATMIGAAVAGVLVDRFDPRRVMLASELAFVPAILSLVTADTMTELTVMAPMVWFVGSITQTAITSFPPFLSTDEDRIAVTNTRMEAASTIAFVLGPVIGAVTVQLADVAMVFVVDAATSVVGAALLYRVHVRQVATTTEDEARTGLSELVAGFRYAYANRPIVLLLVLGTFSWLSFGAFGALEPIFYRDVLGTGPEALGYLNAIFGVGLFLGAVALDRVAQKVTMIRSVVVLTTLSGIGAYVYIGTASLTVVAIGAVLWGTLLGALFPLLRTLTHLHTQEGYVGRVTSVFNVHHSVGELVPLAVAPALATVIGVQNVLIAMGVLTFLGAPLFWGRARRIDAERPVQPDPERGLPERLGEVEEHVPVA